jgi:hypothetical protein
VSTWRLPAGCIPAKARRPPAWKGASRWSAFWTGWPKSTSTKTDMDRTATAATRTNRPYILRALSELHNVTAAGERLSGIAANPGSLTVLRYAGKEQTVRRLRDVILGPLAAVGVLCLDSSHWR